ncbi:hypothetical protein CDAR_457601 [Caerostris darwini]|uniref:Uncharacterized protein n=1 Tax=Caerostris darwini TaxID=1538125 RepID=A0AAV4M8A1_9ARAC|nr:hypothetical protein CDAR_457601 [Caerostris darwini]
MQPYSRTIAASNNQTFIIRNFIGIFTTAPVPSSTGAKTDKMSGAGGNPGPASCQSRGLLALIPPRKDLYDSSADDAGAHWKIPPVG